ncbi:LamG-like jellyroll fold domain-containing protein, partial [Kitasatospora sp. NPDC049285]|uniref:LamG-like jellyroll fold domain-containing protein n=1 Tax=Kitasatospora sp. NPDC049285 TaxID=3157096 RepID=UPI00343160B0
DLKVTADTLGGFSEVFVVKDAKAAANPALKKLSFATTAKGVDLATDQAGNLTAKDKHGRTLFSAPAPDRGVWDSAADQAAPTVTEPKSGAKLDAKSGFPAASSHAEAGAHAHTGKLTSEYRDGAVTLTPDQDLLSGKDTVWPLYIDPSYSAGGQLLNWTYVASAFSGTSYWRTSDSTGLRVGYNGWQSPYYVGRAFAQMTVAPQLAGAQISASTFYATETWSPSCNGRNVELWATDDGIDSNTNWSNQPAMKYWQDTKWEAHGYSSSCPTQSVGFNMTGAMQTAVNNGKSDLALGLKASDEGDSYGWKKFQPSSMSISTTYNHAPTAPTSLFTSPGTACDAATPTVVGNGDITLYSGVNDADGGSLNVSYTVRDNATGAVVASNTLAATAGTNAAYVIPRATLQTAAAGKLTTFNWTVVSSDGSLSSPASATCRFSVDLSVPGQPTVTQQATSYKVGTDASFTVAANASAAAPSSYLYQLNGGAPRTVAASSGNATITLKPTRRVNTLNVTAVSPGGNIGDTAVVSFGAAAPATALDGDLTGQGRTDLAVVGKQGTLPSGLWLASGITTGTLNSAADNIGAKGTGVNTNGGPADWNGTQVITGHFATGDGFNDYLAYNPATGSASILYGNGDGSVLNPVSGSQANVGSPVFTASVGGSKASQIANAGALYETASVQTPGIPGLLMLFKGQLTLTGGTGSPGAYGAADNGTILTSANPAGGADWTGWTITTALVNNLPALYARNTTTGELWYYSPTVLTNLATNLVQGTSATPTAPVKLAASGWTSAAKPVLQAADINRDGTVDLWSVDSSGKAVPSLFDGTTLASQTGQNLVAPTHAWPLGDVRTEGAKAATAADVIGTAPFTGSATGATFSTKDLFNPDVHLDGAAGTLTAGQAAALNGAFTVSVWAKASAAGGTVLSQDGAQTAGFTLNADSATNQWTFCMATADTAGAGTDCARPGPGSGTVQAEAWTHLTAVYDGATMTLYINGVSAGTKAHTAVAGFTGSFRAGAARTSATAVGGWFKGALSTAQVWGGTALTAAQVATLSGTPGYILSPGVSVRNSLSSRCLYVSWRNPDNGAPAQQVDCDSTYIDQLWKIEPVATGGYQLRDVFTNRCLVVYHWTPDNGAQVSQHDCNPGFADQVWYLDPVSTGGYQLRNAYSNRCAFVSWRTPESGAYVYQWDCNPAFADQVWMI